MVLGILNKRGISMKKCKAYYNRLFVPLVKLSTPEGSEAINTILDRKSIDESKNGVMYGKNFSPILFFRLCDG
jgi:hypothetical protein